MKTILIGLHPDFKANATLAYVIALAEFFDSHVIGYYPIPSTVFVPLAADIGMVPSDDSLKSFYERRLSSVREAFEDRMKKTSLTFEFQSEALTTSAMAEAIAKRGRCCDIIILTGPAADEKHLMDNVGFLADTILAAGRPVIVVPQSNKNDFGLGRVALAWNASRESTRAAFDALPLLKASQEVLLTWINPSKSSEDDLPGADIAEALASHDVTLCLKPLTQRRKVGASLHDLVAEHEVDLLVMGAYGRSRLRERILGGATETVLSGLPCPVLFSN